MSYEKSKDLKGFGVTKNVYATGFPVLTRHSNTRQKKKNPPFPLNSSPEALIFVYICLMGTKSISCHLLQPEVSGGLAPEGFPSWYQSFQAIVLQRKFWEYSSMTSIAHR